MEYIDKKTGQVFETKNISLSNLCGGELDDQFRYLLNDLARHLYDGDTGRLKIELKVSQGNQDEFPTSSQIFIEASLSASYPKIKILDIHKAITDKNDRVVNLVDKSLFDETEE